MNTQNTYQSLDQASSSLAVRAGRLLGKWLEISEAEYFAAEVIPARSAACETATDFRGQDGGWDLAFHRTIMMDIRGVNP